MLTIDTTIEWLGKFNEKIQENKAYLSELDGLLVTGIMVQIWLVGCLKQ